MSIEPGTVIANRFRVVGPLGKGGMGEVFSAENTRTGRRVALKVLRAEAKDKKIAIERFRREARAAGAIQSEFVTQVFDVEDDPAHGIVIVFELLEGESLVERLKRTGPIPLVELWGIVEAVWAGLADAHAAGIIHRDLKPSNVFLETKNGPLKVKILDFGISKLPKEFTQDSLTQVGQSLGTFSFMPPEQIGRAKSVDHRADIYACATLIYQALSGKLPYQGKNAVVVMELKMRQNPLPLAEAMGTAVDAALEAFIAKGLARAPEDRFQTALEAIEAWRALRPEGATSIVNGPIGRIPDAEPEDEQRTIQLPKNRKLPEHTAILAAVEAHRAASVERPSAGSTPRASAPAADEDPSTMQRTRLNQAAAAASPAAVVPSAPSPVPVRPPSPSSPSMPDASQSISVDVSAEVPAPKGSTLKMALGALALMLVGFGLVAVALHFLH